MQKWCKWNSVCGSQYFNEVKVQYITKQQKKELIVKQSFFFETFLHMIFPSEFMIKFPFSHCFPFSLLYVFEKLNLLARQLA